MRQRRRKLADWAAIASLVAFVVLENGGQFTGIERAIGGDKVSFSLGLMADYADQLAASQIPYWNGRWGFGFAALGESQIGAFYPPHVLLFRLLPVHDAFEWNYLLHRILVPIAAYLAARTLTLRPLGAWVSALVYSQGGFAVIHVDHIWAVESMVWFPLVVALTFLWLWKGRRLALALLPLAVALQLSIGHFQIAFLTTVTATLVVGFWFAGGGGAAGGTTGAGGGRNRARRTAGWVFGMALGFGLAAAQLAPTFCLQRYLRGNGALSPEYLATHAVPPWLLPLPLLPYLYAREPLWRSVVWTPARTAPEEYLPFVGMAPLALALLAIARWRRQPLARIALALFLIASALSLGPFLPGHDWLTRLPGFGYFRAAARWTLVSQYALGLLAGLGADRVRRTGKLRRAWGWLTVASLFLAVASVVFWTILDQAARRGASPPQWLVALVDAGLPWESSSAAQRMVEDLARARTWDAETWTAWERIGRPDASIRLIDHWHEVLALELLPTMVVLGIGWLAIILCSRKRFARCETRTVRAVIAVICLIDFGWLHAIFPEAVASRTDLEAADPVFDRLRSLPANTRVLGPGGNWLMSWGLAPVKAYRTLDATMPVPLAKRLDELERDFPNPPMDASSSPDVLMGMSAILRYPLLTPRNRPAPELGPKTTVGDGAALGLWISGSTRFRKLLEERGLRVQAGLAQFANNTAPILVLPNGALTGSAASGYSGLYEREAREGAGAGAGSLAARDFRSRTWHVTTTGPAVVVFGELYLPGWRATITTSKGTVEQPVRPCDSYWQTVTLPDAGEYLVLLEYAPPGFTVGVLLSLASACLYVGWQVRMFRAA